MKKIIGIVMVLLMLMSVTVAWAGVNKDAQPDRTDDGLGLQIFENRELNVPSEEDFVDDEILVKFKPGVGKAKVDKINSKHGSFVRHTSPYTGTRRIAIPEGKTVAEMVKLYQAEDAVEYAEPNHIDRALMVPNDPGYCLQWHLDNTEYGGINMESAWEISTGAGVIVAVLDTGVAYEHHEEFVDGPGHRDSWIIYDQAPDLAGTNFVPGHDFVNDDEHPNDDNSHGTHVAGTIAQTTNNGKGVAGVAFNCSIMPIKTLNADGSGTHTDFTDGVYFAVDNGADVISYSGGGSDSITKMDAVTYAYDNNVTFVAAAGNDGPNGPSSYPAAYDAYCIAVGATRYDETVSYYSTTGDYVDIAAPGGDVRVDQNGDGCGDGVLQNTFDPNTKNPQDFGYWFFQGTSMATPHVSGVAALLIANGVTGPDNVREALESTAEDKGDGWDPAYGWGIVDAYAALQWTATSNNQPVADAGSPYSETEDVTITFDGSASYDLGDDPLTYAWDFGDGSTGTGINPTHAYTAGGTYTVTLVVNDGKVNSEPSTTTADITEVNDPPVADAGSDQTALVDEVVTFDGSESYDDGTITAYDWGFGDATTGTGMTTTHAYEAAGTYTANLIVTDNGRLTGTDTMIVTVTEVPAYTMHIDCIEMSTDSRSAGRNTFVWAVATVTIVDADENPVAGATVSGHWSEATSDIDSGVTDDNGQVSLNSDWVKNPSGETTFTFTVDNVVLSEEWTYDHSKNVETSDSTTVYNI